MAVDSKHNYAKDISKRLLDEEAKQETTWHVVREDLVNFATFAPLRKLCIEAITNFSYKYKLLPKTTEASIVYLDRFLLLRGAKTILDSDSGVKGATGKYSLRTVAMCMLMFSSKYEEIYPSVLISFVKFAGQSQKEFLELEVTLLHTMNWILITSTSVDYIDRYFAAVNCSSKTYHLAMFNLEAS